MRAIHVGEVVIRTLTVPVVKFITPCVACLGIVFYPILNNLPSSNLNELDTRIDSIKNHVFRNVFK
jgi:hypothetical protein